MNIQKELESAYDAYKSNDFEGAHAKVMAIIDALPETAPAYQLLSLILRKTGNMNGAFEAIQRALKFEPKNAEYHNSLGTFYRMVGRPDLAAPSFKAAVDIAPNYAIAAINLGDLHLQDNNPVAALNAFDNALNEHADNQTLIRGRALALKDSLQYELALGALAALPQTPDIALPFGQIFHETGQIKKAKAAFEAGLQHPPTAAQNFKNLVMVIHSHEGEAEAVETINHVLGRAKDNLHLQGVGAQLLSEINHRDAALDILSTADKSFGLHPLLAQTRGNILIEQGDAKGAMDCVSMITQKGQLDASLMSIAARATLMQGLSSEAQNYITHARRLQPLNQYWISLEATLKRQQGDEAYQELYNYDKFVRAYDLEPPPEYDDLPSFIAQLTESLLAQHDAVHHPVGQYLRGGSQTSQNLTFAKDRVIQDFFQALNAPLQDYMSAIGTQTDHIFTVRNTQKHRFTGAWSVRLAGDGFHVNHIHPKGWISSSFYVALPETMGAGAGHKDGWIKFGEPSFKAPDAQGNPQGPEYWVEPKAGRLVLFPSYMWHGTVAFTGDDMRLTLPFDAVPVS